MFPQKWEEGWRNLGQNFINGTEKAVDLLWGSFPCSLPPQVPPRNILEFCAIPNKGNLTQSLLIQVSEEPRRCSLFLLIVLISS